MFIINYLKKHNQRTKPGFTLIELLVTIAIIGILSAVVLVSLSSARAKAKDARRISDLRQIQNSLLLYYDLNENWVETGSGCGSGGNGNGWFNYQNGGSYPKSVAQCLKDAKVMGAEIIDPTGGTTSTYGRYAYMKYHCGPTTQRQVYVYAKLQAKQQNDSATNNTCCTDCDSLYGMNYYLQVQ